MAGIPKTWPDNALRHSYASYHLAHYKNASELALYLGHADTKVISQHYREVVTKEQAKSYWNIIPGA